MGSFVGIGFVHPSQGWSVSRCRRTRMWGWGYSHYFLLTKQTGEFCPIFNLSGLNPILCVSKFHMETLTSVLQSFHKSWWMVLLDLSDAYLHVSIHPSPWRYLQFAPRKLAGKLMVYQWKVLPFGLATVPESFYQTPGSCSGSRASAGISHVSIHRHLPCSRVHQSDSRPQSTLSLQAQVCHKPAEVSPHPGSCNVSSRGFDQHT